MGLAHSPRIVTDGLILCLDAGNVKSYPGSGNTLYSLNGTENVSTTTINVASDATAGTVLNHNTTTQLTVNLLPYVNHEIWSLIVWIRSTGITPSNYRGVVTIRDTNSSHNYFYNMDTRETTNTYILGYQKDYNINSWLTYGFNNQSQWTQQEWWCLGVSHNNTVFRHYVQGNFTNTQTQTRDVAGYGDIDQISINANSSNTVYMGPLLFYDRILTDDEFKQNFNATRGRFGV